MKKFIAIVSALCVLSVGAFAGGKKDTAAAKPAGLKVAALIPGPINDGGWNTLMYKSLKHQEEAFKAEISFTERTPASDYEELFRGYAESGVKIVFGHGFEFGESAMKVAKAFPDTYFIINSTNISQAPNLGSFLVNDFQCGFAQGAIAALVSKTGVVGYVGGMEIPPIINQGNGFAAGAKYINPQIVVKKVLTGNFEDVAKAKEIAASMIAAGADILVGDADEASHGVFEAAKEKGVQVIGCSTDLYAGAPDLKDIVLTSVTEDMPKGHELIVKDILAGKFVAKNYNVGFESGAVDLAPFREKEASLSAAQKAKIKEIIDGLKSGSLNVEAYK